MNRPIPRTGATPCSLSESSLAVVDVEFVVHMIILATCEKEARTLAQEAGLEECFENTRGFRERRPIPFWTDPTKTSCEILTTDGPSHVICMRTLDG